jgi:hypothetical protein
MERSRGIGAYVDSPTRMNRNVAGGKFEPEARPAGWPPAKQPDLFLSLALRISSGLKSRSPLINTSLPNGVLLLQLQRIAGRSVLFSLFGVQHFDTRCCLGSNLTIEHTIFFTLGIHVENFYRIHSQPELYTLFDSVAFV